MLLPHLAFSIAWFEACFWEAESSRFRARLIPFKISTPHITANQWLQVLLFSSAERPESRLQAPQKAYGTTDTTLPSIASLLITANDIIDYVYE
jgi:hypothetical protein